MKKSFLLLSAIILLTFTAGKLYSQQDEASMKKWMEAMTPGDMHKMLAANAGTWKAQTIYWMAPGGEPQKSEATATGEMILGGRYLVSKYSGNMWGMPFEGMEIAGYDNTAKTFNSTWVDNMGTGMLFMTGKYDESKKQINYSGQMMDPLSGKMCNVREIVTHNSDGTMKMEMFGPDDKGTEFKMMEINFTK